MKVGHRLAELLVEYGIEYVFGVPGGQTLALYEGIMRLEWEHPSCTDEG